MTNFDFYSPTKVIFGRNVISRLGEEAAVFGKKALFLYGQGSLKKNGLYDQIKTRLTDARIGLVEHGGVVPNPVISHALEGIELIRKEGIDFIVAAGGGSVIDEAKGIAAGAAGTEELWDYYTKKATVEKALPIIAVQTQPATSSETNQAGVLTNTDTSEKFSVRSPHLVPKVAFLDPEVTFTIPLQYTAYACFDIMSHLLEGYFTTTADFSPVHNGFVEGLVKSVMESLARILKNPEDYDARASIMWAGALAWNGLANAGLEGAMIPNHMLEHPLSGMYNAVHGAGLAVIMPGWLKYSKERISSRIIMFGKNILGMDDLDEYGNLLAACDKVIEKFQNWIRSIGCPLTIAELGIKNPDYDKMADQAMSLSVLWNVNGYTPNKIKEIYFLCE